LRDHCNSIQENEKGRGREREKREKERANGNEKERAAKIGTILPFAFTKV
jgi:hypothetical protein